MRISSTTEILIFYIHSVSSCDVLKNNMAVICQKLNLPTPCDSTFLFPVSAEQPPPHLVLLPCKCPVLLRAQESGTSLWPFSAQGAISGDLQSYKPSWWPKSAAFPTILIGWSQAELFTDMGNRSLPEACALFCNWDTNVVLLTPPFLQSPLAF